jgi:hypothetical protein
MQQSAVGFMPTFHAVGRGPHCRTIWGTPILLTEARIGCLCDERLGGELDAVVDASRGGCKFDSGAADRWRRSLARLDDRSRPLPAAGPSYWRV